jgi:hypothetical protein
VAVFPLQQDVARGVEADHADAHARRLDPGVFVAVAVGQFHLIHDDADPAVAKGAVGGQRFPADRFLIRHDPHSDPVGAVCNRTLLSIDVSTNGEHVRFVTAPTPTRPSIS